MITPGDGLKVEYKLAHDRIQQAAYSLLSEDQKKQTHLKIALVFRQSCMLELCCGSGGIAILLAEKGWQVT